MVEERQQAVAHKMAGGLMAGEHEEHAVGDHLFPAQLFGLRFYGKQRAYQIIAGIFLTCSDEFNQLGMKFLRCYISVIFAILRSSEIQSQRDVARPVAE